MKEDSTKVKWIKLDIGLFDNEKIKLIRKMPDGAGMIVIWIQLLCLAGRSNNNGFIQLTSEIPYTEEMLCVACDCTLQMLRMALGMFEKFGMIEVISDIYYVTNWSRYQSADGLERIREQNRLRKKKERERNEMKLLGVGDTIATEPQAVPEEKHEKKARHAHGEYGWVKLTDEEYAKLINDLGQTELNRCITYIDESAQGNGNKNKWKDWNLVIRKCSRQKWGCQYGTIPATVASAQPSETEHYSPYEDWDREGN